MDISESAALLPQLIRWRRDFHQYPEQGFLEMRTATLVARELARLGFHVRLGREVMDEAQVMGKPDAHTTQAHAQWALANGAAQEYFAAVQEGYTAVVGEWQSGKAGPVTVFRVDMDALPIVESSDAAHFPAQHGFASQNPGSMHACAHDGHTAIGLGLATLIARHHEALTGTLRIIFQCAEEGVRGAKSMMAKGVVDDADYFIALHLGTGVPMGHFVAAAHGFLATSKLDVSFHGIAAHAGAAPHEGRNALLAAAAAAVNLHAIARHSGGASRINVGELHAGRGRNIVPDHATLKLETRGANAQVNDYVREQALNILAGAAQMYDVEHRVTLVGEAISAVPSAGLAEKLMHAAQHSPHIRHVQLKDDSSLGSEDAAFFMQRVQKRGGEATYCIVGTTLAAGHHHERFDIDEQSLAAGVDVLLRAAYALNSNPG